MEPAGSAADGTTSSPRVRDIARRFEPSGQLPGRQTPTKRIGKFRVNEHGQMFRISQPSGRVGAVARRKSSLKKRSSSWHEFPAPAKKEQPLKKSCTIEGIASEIRPTVPVTVPSPRPRKPAPPAKPPRLLTSPPPPAASPNPSEQTLSPKPPVPLKPPTLARPRCPPPAPPLPPSKERLSRIPSHLTQQSKRERMRRRSSSDDEFYQKLHSPERNGTVVRAVPARVSDEIPRVPSIPIPRTPSLEMSDDSTCYEEIDVRFRAENDQPSTSSAPQPSESAADYNYVTNIYCDENDSSHSAMCSCSSCLSQRRFSQSQLNHIETSAVRMDRSFHLGTIARQKKPSRRPVSTLEFDKLIKFKSDFQLNLTKKMEQLRQKVGDRKQWKSSKVVVDADQLATDHLSSECSTVRAPDDERYIYGDDWSSDDDENAYNDRRSSMYKELEEQLNKTFPQPKMSSESEYESADFSSLPDRPDDLDMENLKLEPRKSVDEPSPDYDYSHQYTSRLTNGQPLYQIYMLEEQEKLVDEAINQEPAEEVAEKETPKSRRESSVSSDSGRGADYNSGSTPASTLTSNTSMRRDRLVAGSHFGSQRSLWCELPEVKAAGLLESLDEETKLLQEAFFEVITSEASYLRSLNILITHFMASQELLGSKSASSVISNDDRKHLFSNIFAVRDCSERLLCDLESRLEENLILDDISDILLQHFESNFDVYVKYCSNQVFQDRTLKRLKTENCGFLASVSRLESDRQCQGLDMRSFLMLPMQRITRYPLLMYAILDRLPSDSPKSETASKALAAANTVVHDCNEGARRMEITEQLMEVDKRLIYNDPELRRIPLVSNGRYLVKRGTLTQLVERRTKGLLQSRQKARSVHVFLFSDMIMITKKKVNGSYICKDYCARRFVEVEPIEPDNPKVPAGALSSVTRPHLLICFLMRNARNRMAEFLLSAESETDRERWLSAIRPPTSVNPDEKIYAEWDCPQVVVVSSYMKVQDDEMDLRIGDVINILRKMPDGWLYGERCRDGVGGWFPSSYVQQILNDHVRANNYRQRLRLIQAAAGSPRGTVGRGAAPFMDRLRRMSNPRNYFASSVSTEGTIGL